MATVRRLVMLRPITLTPEHIPQALSLSAALNWPYREEDWRFALELGHGVAVEADGRLVATAMWWPYAEAFASFGMIIVTPTLQGRGIGRLMVTEMLRQANERTVVLNSTREGHRLYEALGFVPYGQVNQHQAVLETRPPEPLRNGIRPFQIDDVAAIRALDRCASGMGRERLLDALFAVGSVVVIERARELKGYACVRRSGRGVVIGPVIAPDVEDAKALTATLSAQHVNSFVRIDVTEASGLSPWLAKIGLPCVDHVVSMARGAPPAQAAGATLFALANQSLG
jgi:GNAT superfamily N-acetyltransferase